MKKSILGLTFAISLLLLASSSAYAFTPGDFGSRFRSGETQELREDKKATSEARRLENREENIDERRQKIGKLFDVMIKKYEAAVARLKTLISKIESRVAIIKAANPEKDVTNIESQILDAKNKLAAIPAKIDTLKADFDATLASTTPKDLFKQVMADAKAIKKDLKEVHQILVYLIGDVRGLRIGED